MQFWPLLLLLTGAGSNEPVEYQCLDGTSFILVTTDQSAIVKFDNGEYRLGRRPSSLAIKYESNTATLYLDGDIAAFVADDRPLPGCHKFKMKDVELSRRPEKPR